LFSQNISGLINQYEPAGAVMGPNSIFVAGAANLSLNDTVLIIQMQGAVIDHTNSASYGDITNLNNTGNFEFNIIDNINLSTHIVSFKCNFSNAYTGLIQLVKVRTFQNATVVASLTANQWNGSSGGVIALIVNGTLTLNADINASGRGFRGALPSYSLAEICSSTDLTAFAGYHFTSLGIDSSGLKGEGIASPNSFFERGRGKNANGGGGGHSLDAAGGGGSGYGYGGKGGKETEFCPIQGDFGGIGGISLSSFNTGTPKLFMGGGGGAGLYDVLTGNDATAGGNGGGIVIIQTGQLIANSHTISANGASVVSAVTATESAGGGGGGGVIVLKAQGVTGTLNITATGGNGGNTSNSSIYFRGSGGGGGGGLIQLNAPLTGILTNTNGGSAGTAPGSFAGQGGNNGSMINGFVIPMGCLASNAITNNIISGNTSGCIGQTYSINGTLPGGGNGSYAYLWEQSSDNILWTSCPAPNNLQNYSTVLSVSLFYRRKVVSGIDNSISNVLHVVASQVVLTPSHINPSCAGSCNGAALTGITGTTGYNFVWSTLANTTSIINLCDGVYNVTVTNTSTGCTATANYNIISPPLLQLSITASSSPTCIYSNNGTASIFATGGTPPYAFIWSDGTTGTTSTNLSVGTNHVTVTDFNGCVNSTQFNLSPKINITNNLIQDNQIFCGTTPRTPFPQNGNLPVSDSLFSYLWEETNDLSFWSSGVNANNVQNYQPPSISQKTWYRRIVFSGGCIDTSNVDTVKFLPGSTEIISNSVSPSTQIVNVGAMPATFIGSTPTGGDGSSYFYFWVKSTDVNFTQFWQATEGTNTSQNFVFSQVADTSFYYDRFVYIMLPSSEIACQTPSNPVRVLTNFISCADTNLCQGVTATVITGNADVSYTYEWQQNSGTFWVNIPGANTSSYTPGILASTVRFRRIVTSTTIIDTSNVITIHVTPPISNNIIYTTTLSPVSISVNYGTTTTIGNTNSPTGGNGSYAFLWRFSSDNITFTNAPPINTANGYFTPAIYDTLYFKRIVNSGSCTSISNTLAVYPIYPPNTISIANDHICNGGLADTIKNSSGIPPVGITFNWEIKLGPSTVWQTISGATGLNYFPGTLSDSASFRRIFYLVSNSYPSNVITIHTAFVTLAATNPIIVCGNSAMLDAIPVTTGTGWWTAQSGVNFVTPNSLYNSEISIPAFTTNSYSHSLYWHVNDLICEDSLAISVIFYHTINTPDAGIDISLTNENSVTLDATPPPYGTGNWSVFMGGASFVYANDAHTTASSILSGENILRWTVTNGPCLAQHDDVKVTVTNSNIPEGFSPNGDGVNDYFEVAGIDNYPGSEFIVFNRWGIEVYRKKVYDNKWDGKTTSGIILPEDTYFYLLKFDENETKKGYIVLKR
jgi:gliding motility-associated-like protein